MTALKKTANVPEFFENRIKDEPSLDEYTFASVKSLCARFDLGQTTMLRIIRRNRVQRYNIAGVGVRYRVMDIVRLIDKEI